MLRIETLGGLRLVGRDGQPAELRPRRLALLAILAAAGAKGVSRERVLGILWTESEPERARHSLSQTLYSLRRELGVDVVVATSTLRLDPDRMTSDIDEFRMAVAAKDWDRATALFAGPFLHGFYVNDAPEFERWADEERAAVSREAVRALETSARDASADRDRPAAIAALRRLVKLDPLNPRFALALADELMADGDRTGALAYARAHADAIRRELDADPDSEVLRRLEDLRVTGEAAVAPPASPVVAASRASAPAPAPPTPRPRASLRWGIAAGVILVFAIGVPLWSKRGQSSRSAEVRTSSPLAARLYEDGIRAYYQFDPAGATRLLGAALKEDPNFAIAAYFAWRAEIMANGPRQSELGERSRSLAARAPERDRALILLHLAGVAHEMSAIVTAESLVVRYPNDPEILIRAADISSELPRAVALIDRAVGLDSARAAEPNAICRSCDAFQLLAYRYEWADSSARVEETLNRWTALRPADYQPWLNRADILVGLGRKLDAEAALHHADSLGAARGDSSEAALVRNLRLSDVDAANAICRAKLASAVAGEFLRYRWLCTIALRGQGRYRDALSLVRTGRLPGTNTVRGDVVLDRVHAAVLDMEMGRPTTAAVQYASLATEVGKGGEPHGALARSLAWNLTLSATASAAAGDSIRVRSLVDSVELIGQRSLFPRDRLLHHFLRGLLLAQAGEHGQAVREFRAATSSPSQGYTRINLELAKSLLALRRASEAVPVLRAVLHGGIEGSGLYVTRTEIHELLARAFAQAGEPDSATAHYAVVEQSWRGADSSFANRYGVARDWLLRHAQAAR